MKRDDFRRGLVSLVWVVFAAFFVGIALVVLSGGCASEGGRAVVRAKPSPAAGPTRGYVCPDHPDFARTFATEKEYQGHREAFHPGGKFGNAAMGTTDTGILAVRAAAYDEKPITSEGSPPDKNLLPTQARLKKPLVEVKEDYLTLRDQAAFIQADLKGDLARLQGQYRKKERGAAEKLSKKRKKFLTDTGILAEEAAALFEPKKQGGEK